jgi:2-polyprenyl-3-methyl-5-hydroxy-6-metoxy-1,4-benzoquinol methylase
MPWLSDWARGRKCGYFVDRIAKSSRVLEVGCGAGWLGRYMRENGWTGYVGLDVHPPADVVGDVLAWRELGLEPESFDVVIAFEVIEHVDCVDAFFDLLKPGGLLMLTSPTPRWDWACRVLEAAGLAQRRTSPHSHLVDFRGIPRFEPVALRRFGVLSQWGIFRKPVEAGS